MNNSNLAQEEIEVISTDDQTLRQNYFRYQKKMNTLNFSIFICVFILIAFVGWLWSFKVLVWISVGIILFLLLVFVSALVDLNKKSKISFDVSYDEFIFQSDAFIVTGKSKSNTSTTKVLYNKIVGLVETKDFFLMQLEDNKGYLIEVNGNEQALWKVKRKLFPYIKVFNQIKITKKTKIEECEYADNSLKLLPSMILLLNLLLFISSVIVYMACMKVYQNDFFPFLLFPIFLIIQLAMIGGIVFLGIKSRKFKKSIFWLIIISIFFCLEFLFLLSYIL